MKKEEPIIFVSRVDFARRIWWKVALIAFFSWCIGFGCGDDYRSDRRGADVGLFIEIK